jgi:uncharacterized repeat protein (TIGR03803 family)
MKKSQVLALCLALPFALLSAASSPAQTTEKTVLSFNFNNGTLPGGAAFDRSGNLWVVTGQGGNGTACGTTGCGAVVEFTPSSGGWTSHVIYNFHGGSDGEYPAGRLYFDSKGNAYGTTQEGGAKCNCGTVYELSFSQGGWKETVLYRFDSNRNHIDGLTPYSGLIADAAGNLYGTSITGGASGWGTVYELSLNPHGYWTERVLWSFLSPNFGTDGSLIYGGLAIDASGNLYGATYAGGAAGDCSGTTGCGAVFELSPGANGVWSERVIYNFLGGSDGARSYAELIFDNAGNLYGTTLYGGSTTECSGLGCGTVFELSPAADGTWTESVLHAFSETDRDGLYPRSGLVFDQAGNLDGVTSYGGKSNWGTAFSLTPGSDGVWSETLLYNFALVSGVIPSTTPVIDASGNIYGTALTGGANRTGLCSQGLQGCGSVFEIKP